MSTNDVPGHKASNGDTLAMGCWAEHSDGSLMFVESTEMGRVIYSVFDMAKSPVIEYRDAMPEVNFKRMYSYGGGSGETWTWHDKTPFPWDRVIKEGARDGMRYASARDQMNAAERVAERLRLRGAEYDDRHESLQEREVERVGSMMAGLSKALNELPGQIATAIQGATSKVARRRKK